MAKAFGFSEDDAKRVAAATRRIEGMPQGNRPRSRQYPVPTSQSARIVIIDTPNCCVDQFNLGFGGMVDGVLRYVEGYRVDPVTGITEGDVLKIYAGKGMTGFLCKGCRVEVTRVKGRIVAIGTAQLDADAVITVTAGPSLAGKATLFPDDPGDGEHVVYDVTVATKCDTVAVDTEVRVKWQLDPVANTSSLVIEDACCTPAESEPFGGE